MKNTNETETQKRIRLRKPLNTFRKDYMKRTLIREEKDKRDLDWEMEKERRKYISTLHGQDLLNFLKKEVLK